MHTTFSVYVLAFLLLPASLNAEPCPAPGPNSIDETPADANAGLPNVPQTVSTEHFLIGSEDVNAAYALQVAEVLESAYKKFDSAFNYLNLDIRSPDEKLVWICFSDRSSFREYSIGSDRMDLSHMSGYYSSRTNRVAILQAGHHLLHTRKALAPAMLTQNTGCEPVLQNHPLIMTAELDADEYTDVTRITHELAHQLAFNCGIQKRLVMYPIWVSEGLAAAFEEILYPAQYLEGRNSIRTGTLSRMHTQHNLICLESFLPMTRMPPSLNTDQEIYAQSWGLFFFLSRYRTSDLKDYLQRLAAFPPGRRSAETLTDEFVASFGPISELENSWNAFLESLLPKPEAKTAAITSEALVATQ